MLAAGAEFAWRVAPAHPGHLRLIFRSKRKSDRVDAGKLATLLYLDQVATAYLPVADVRAWRSLIEHRQRLIRKRTRVKSAIRALLRNLGIEAPRGLWGRKGRTWLEATWVAIRRSGTVRAWFEHVQRGDVGRKKIAAVATACYPARVMLVMLKTGEIGREAS